MGVPTAAIEFPSGNVRDYATAIGLNAALDGEDRYTFERKNEGTNYSGLVLLATPEETDRATSQINGCIRALFPEPENLHFVRTLCEVVGDLHDNVWSHGKATGFSMAQKWRNPHARDAYHLEFALADCGYGFRRELLRVGLTAEAASDRSAIEWCLVKGHSSKNLKCVDEWAQTLPPDIMGNPIPGVGKARESDNHHQGLGLAKLVGVSGDIPRGVMDGVRERDANPY
jgi:hypothetical protein